MKKRKDRKNNPTVVFAVLMIFLLPVLIYFFIKAAFEQKGLMVPLGIILGIMIVVGILLAFADHKIRK